MNSFLSFTYRHKKILLVAVFVLFAAMIFAAPQPASAEDCGLDLNLVGCAVSKGFKGLIAIPGFTIILVDTIVDQVLGWLIGLILNGVSYTSLDPTVNSAVALGWPIARDFANILVVIGFIVIALATILRWPAWFAEYEAKKILGKLIIAALLINFSLVICGIVIDASHVVMRFFLVSVNTTFIEQLDVAARNLTNGVASNNVTVIGFAVSVLSVLVVGIMKAVAYSLYVILFLFRIVAIWILVILSPIAFICRVFPDTENFYVTWRNNFFQWCTVGIYGAFFINLGTRIASAQLANPPEIPASIFIGDFAAAGTAFTSILNFMVPGIFLIVGFIFSLQLSAAGGSLATSAAKKIGGYARAGAQRGVLGFAKFQGRVAETGLNEIAGRTGLMKQGQTIRGNASNMLARGLEATGIQRPGYAAKQEQDRLASIAKENDSEARIAAGGDSLQKSIIAGGAGHDANSHADYVAAVKAQQKDHKPVDEAGLDAYVAVTGDYSAYSKDPRYAKKNKPKIDALIAEGKTREEAEEILTAKAWSKFSVADIRDMSEDLIKKDEDIMNFILSTTAQKISKAGEDMSQEKIKMLSETKLLDRIAAKAKEAYDKGDTKTSQDLEAKYRAIVMLATGSADDDEEEDEIVEAKIAMDMDALSDWSKKYKP